LCALAFTLLPGPAAAWTFTQVDVPGARNTYANGLNRLGQVVGSYSDGKDHGFLRDPGGTFTPIDVPDALATEATGIVRRRIVGSYEDPASLQWRGFLAKP
jgi:hypothetical protein